MPSSGVKNLDTKSHSDDADFAVTDTPIPPGRSLGKSGFNERTTSSEASSRSRVWSFSLL